MFLKAMRDAEILSQLKILVAKEREILTETLYHLLEVQERKLHLEEGYPSLYSYCVEVLGYTEAQAYRRLSAMQLLKEIPELKKNIESGSLNLTHLTQAKKYFKSESENANPLSKDEKLELLTSLENKTTRETEKIFAGLNPDAIPEDKERVIRENLTEIRFVASDALLEKLKRFKELDAHVLSNPNYADLFERLVDLALHVKDNAFRPKPKKSNKTLKHKMKKAEQWDDDKRVKSFVAPKKPCINEDDEVLSECCEISSKNRTRAIPVFVKRVVVQRDGASCVFVNPVTGKRCGSKYKLQFEHKIPFAKKGEHSPENLTILCQQHNLLMAEKHFGKQRIRSYSSTLH